MHFRAQFAALDAPCARKPKRRWTRHARGANAPIAHNCGTKENSRESRLFSHFIAVH
jgi:hypothetical protein